MYKIKNNKQMELFDPRSFLSPKRRNRLDKSWAGLFREEILEELPVEKIIPFFKESGRPSKELYTVLGALLLQQFFDYTDEETIAQLSFNIQWHYSFNITEESDSAKYFCARILWEMRKIGIEAEIEDEIFEQVTKKLSTVFKVDTNKQRIDSVHIRSNMRRPGKIGIFSTKDSFLIFLIKNLLFLNFLEINLLFIKSVIKLTSYFLRVHHFLLCMTMHDGLYERKKV